MKTKEIPVTQAMLYGVRDELMARLSSHDHQFKSVDSKFVQIDARFEQMDARFEQVDARFEQVDARFDQVNARFEQVDARFDQVDARFDQVDARFDSLEERVIAEIRRLGVLVEEQRAQNIYVLDGITNLSDRVGRTEERLTHLENQSVLLKPPTKTPR